MSLDECRIVDIPRFADGRGYLGVIESGEHTPFEIKRVYFLYDIPDGSVRGEHGHRELEQLIIALAGSFRSRSTTVMRGGATISIPARRRCTSRR